MALILLIGPHAVGKMTVGQDLAAVSGYKLFHNHVPIELVAPFFSYGSADGRKLVHRVRQAFFDAFCADQDGGYIFTFVWAFDVPGEREYIEGIIQQFADSGHETYLIELEARLDERIRRNRTENRLAHKPSKRDIAWSEDHLIQSAETYRLNSHPGEIAHPSYLRIDTTELQSEQVAAQIWEFVTSAAEESA